MTRRLGIQGAALLGLVATAALARADEEKISPKKLPAAVTAAVKKAFPEAKILAASKEVEKGATTFEVELKVEGRSVDMALDASGKILEIEKELDLRSLPKPVARRLAARYPGARIKKVEEITRGEGGPVHYEVALEAEVVLTAKGKIVRPEAEEEDEEDDKPAAKAGKAERKDDKAAAKAARKGRKQDKDDDDDDDDDEDDDDRGTKRRERDDD